MPCVIKKMQNLKHDFSPIGNIIDEAMMMILVLTIFVLSIRVEMGNKVANCLTEYELNGEGESVRVEECPPFCPNFC